MAEHTNPNYYGPATPKLQCPPPYLRTIHGKLKIPEMILSILVFSISFSAYYSGAGMVEFAGFWTFVEVTIWFILHSVDIIPRIAWNYMMELWCYLANTIFLFLAGIIAAVGSGKQYGSGDRASLGFASFFAFTAMAICGYDGYLQVLEYRARRANAETARHPGQFDTSIPDQFGTSSIGQPGYRPTDPTGYGDTQPGVVRTTTTTVVTEYVAADRSVTSPPAYSADPSKLMY